MAASKCTAPAENTAVSDITCTPCGRTGRRVKPEKLCLECDEYYCSRCLPYHGKFPSMKDHTVEDVSGSNVDFPCTSEAATPTDVKLPSDVPSIDHNVKDASGSNVEVLRTIQLATPTDVTRRYYVPSIVRLASGSFLVCDWHNKALKMLDGNYAVVDDVRFTDNPHTVCLFNENEVAVSLRDKKKIVFVTLEKGLRLSSRQPVKTEDKCQGMAYVNGELYVASGGDKDVGPGKVEVHSISGRRIIDTDAGGTRLFGIPVELVVNPTGSEIHIADYTQGVVTINPIGTVIRRLSDPVLRNSQGICMDDQGNLFVAGNKSQNVVKIEKDGSMKVVLSESDGVVNPTSLCFDPEKRCLLVGMFADKPLVAFKINE